MVANIAGASGGFVIDAGARPIDRICSETLELLLRSTGYNDDVTLLTAQRRTPLSPAVESRSGIASLTIDLSGVTQLGSAGISALAAARDRAQAGW